MSGRPDQHTARVNVDSDAWRRFKILAIDADCSIADYLGQLVRDELKRSTKRHRRVASAESETGASERRQTGAKSRSPVRLSEARLLTEWPRRER